MIYALYHPPILPSVRAAPGLTFPADDALVLGSHAHISDAAYFACYRAHLGIIQDEGVMPGEGYCA